MTMWILLAALLTALILCSLGVSLYALYRANRIARQVTAAAENARQEFAAVIAAVQSRVETVSESLSASIQEAVRDVPPPPTPRAPKSCMNLTKRSQALRLRRKGDSPEQIAQALEIPRQEVDLLLKVHDIVFSTL